MKIIPIYKLHSDFSSKVLNSGKWVDGEQIKELELKIKDYLKVRYVVLTNNGTSALLAAYWVLRKRYKRLTVDPYTFPASYQPAALLGYQIKFKRTFLTDYKETNDGSLRTIVHLFGQPNPMLEKMNGVFIEDACQSFGAEFKGKKVGTLGIMGCFSFYPTKSLHTCGHGGAVVTNDKKCFEQLKVFIESSRINGKLTENIALNLRMDEIKAEFLLNELKTYERKIKIQRDLAKKLSEIIPSPQPFLSEETGNRHIYSVFNLVVKERDQFRQHMKEAGIETLIYYGDEVLPKNERLKYKDLTSSIVAIPCRWNLTKEEIVRIKTALRNWFL